MSALWLKLTALFIMLIDHSAVVLRWSRIIGSYRFYRVLRGIGRVAFPIFGFQLVQGAMHTKCKWKYLLRMLLLAVLSDFPFDLALNFTWFDPNSQNVFWTLSLGLVSVFAIQYASELKTKVYRVLGFLGAVLLTLGLAWLAEDVLYTDYGNAGVYMIAAMGLLTLPLPRQWSRMGLDRLVNVAFSALGIGLCVLYTNSFEAFAFFSLIPIALYNGRKGYKSRIIQYGAYLFYPAHLLVLGILIVLPRIGFR